MPAPFEPASEDAMIVAAVTAFLEQADTKALHESFVKSQLEIKELREATASLREAITKIAEDNKTLCNAVPGLRATVDRLEDHAKRCDGLEAKCEALHGKYHELQDRHHSLHESIHEARRATADQSQNIKEALRSDVIKVEERMVEVMSRQDMLENALEQIGHLLQKAHVPQSRSQRHDQYWTHPVAASFGADDSGLDANLHLKEDSFGLVLGGQSRTRAQEREANGGPDCIASQSSVDSPDQRRIRPRPINIDDGQQYTQGSARNQSATQRKEHPQVVDELGTDKRATLVAEHWRAAKRRYSATSKKNQRKFVWDFIKGFKDPEFMTWFQELLLLKLPEDMVHPRAHPNRGPGGEIIAFTTKVTWDAVSQIFERMRTPPFF